MFTRISPATYLARDRKESPATDGSSCCCCRRRSLRALYTGLNWSSRVWRSCQSMDALPKMAFGFPWRLRDLLRNWTSLRSFFRFADISWERRSYTLHVACDVRVGKAIFRALSSERTFGGFKSVRDDVMDGLFSRLIECGIYPGLINWMISISLPNGSGRLFTTLQVRTDWW